MTAEKNRVLQVEDLEFHYDQPLINIASFDVARHECVGLIGPSGCGKTTFIHLIAGLLQPIRGHIQINGVDLSQLSERETDRLRGRYMGVVFQRLHLIPSVSVIDNLLLAQRFSRTKVDRSYAVNLLEELGIAALKEKKPSQLSQGQAQRVAIARSLAHRPALVVADEPTSALDDGNAADAMRLMRTLTAHADAGLVIVTHDQRVRREVDRVVNLGDVA
ncbi:MAG: ATP-binding cassette domain-containing protein [Gammaproteobacteria bacterium]|nr:ATP-binding cassette domain-containing protein [Gammaproteobacteria bacterium]